MQKVYLKDKFAITDTEKLKNKLKEANISFNQELDPLCWIFDLFRTFSTGDIDLEDVGITVKSEFLNIPLSRIKEDINQEFFELSLAHYERYIVRESVT